MHVASDCCILVLHSSTSSSTHSVACRSQQCAYMNNFAEQGSKRIAGSHLPAFYSGGSVSGGWGRSPINDNQSSPSPASHPTKMEEPQTAVLP